MLMRLKGIWLIGMDSYSDIISKRALAGVMIFNAARELIYVNEEAKKFISTLIDIGDVPGDGAAYSPQGIPEVMLALCDELMAHVDGEKDKKKHFIYKNILCGEEDFFLRAIPIHRISREKGTSHVMVTVERFSTRLTTDVKKVGLKFGLTKRETEVLKGVARGMTNKDISSVLFISEHTVKDHIRSIMKKIEVNNRSLLICKIFECNQ